MNYDLARLDLESFLSSQLSVASEYNILDALQAAGGFPGGKLLLGVVGQTDNGSASVNVDMTGANGSAGLFLETGADDTISVFSPGGDVLATGDGSNNWLVDTGVAGDTLVGGLGADTLQATGGNNVLIAGGGQQVLIAGTGQDTLVGSYGSDTLNADSVFGGSGTLIRAGSGPTVINGGPNADTIYGGTGADTINVGSGNASIYTSGNPNGPPANTVINAGSGSDSIYVGAGSHDVVMSSGYNTNVVLGVNANSGLTVTDDPSTHTAQLQFMQGGSFTTVELHGKVTITYADNSTVHYNP